MQKMYRFTNGEKEVNVIAESESQARAKAKFDESFWLVATYTLNETWSD